MANNIDVTCDQARRQESDLPKMVTIQEALTRNAKTKLKYAIQKSNLFKKLENDIVDLTMMLKAEKDADLIIEIENRLNELKLQRQRLVNIQKNEKTALIPNKGIKENSALALFKERRLFLEDEFKKHNPDSLVHKVRTLREKLGISNSEDYAFYEDESDDTIDVIDDVDTNYQQQYKSLLSHIQFLTNENVSDKSLYAIRNLLIANVDSNHLNILKTELEYVKSEANRELKRLNGSTEFTDIIWLICDKTKDVQKAKDLLACSYTEYVKTIAFRICNNLSMLHCIEDAIGYGMMGLATAIKAWYELQERQDETLSFNGYSYMHILTNIKKGMYDMQSGGMVTKNVYSSQVLKRKQQIEDFIKSQKDEHKITIVFSDGTTKQFVQQNNNINTTKRVDGISKTEMEQAIALLPANATKWKQVSKDYDTKILSKVEVVGIRIFKNPFTLNELSEDELCSLIGDVEQVPSSCLTESSFTNDSGENMFHDFALSVDDSRLIDCKHEYEDMIHNIMRLFELRQSKLNKISGEIEISDTKIFDKYEVRLFMLYYGLEYKKTNMKHEKSIVSAAFTQEDIADELTRMYKANNIDKSLTQSAVNYRINELEKKIVRVLDEYPSIKRGFRNMLSFCTQNRDAVNIFSNMSELQGSIFSQENIAKNTKNIYIERQKMEFTSMLQGKGVREIPVLADEEECIYQ